MTADDKLRPCEPMKGLSGDWVIDLEKMVFAIGDRHFRLQRVPDPDDQPDPERPESA